MYELTDMETKMLSTSNYEETMFLAFNRTNSDGTRDRIVVDSGDGAFEELDLHTVANMMAGFLRAAGFSVNAVVIFNRSGGKITSDN
jgi:hypothetical protein